MQMWILKLKNNTANLQSLLLTTTNRYFTIDIIHIIHYLISLNTM